MEDSLLVSGLVYVIFLKVNFIFLFKKFFKVVNEIKVSFRKNLLDILFLIKCNFISLITANANMIIVNMLIYIYFQPFIYIWVYLIIFYL